MVRIVGHRGASGLAPENTLSGVRRAVDVGVDSVEFDVRETADDRLVVIHDSSVDRTTDGTGDVGDLTLAEIKRLDAGDGQEIPSLGEMLDEVATHGVGTYVELKEAGIAERTVAAVEERGLTSSARFTSWDPDYLEAIADSDVAIGGPIDDIEAETFQMAADLGYGHVGIHHEDLTAELVDRVHKYGLAVTAWPVNERTAVERTVDFGVDAITTDRPDIVRSVLTKD